MRRQTVVWHKDRKQLVQRLFLQGRGSFNRQLPASGPAVEEYTLETHDLEWSIHGTWDPALLGQYLLWASLTCMVISCSASLAYIIVPFGPRIKIVVQAPYFGSGPRLFPFNLTWMVPWSSQILVRVVLAGKSLLTPRLQQKLFWKRIRMPNVSCCLLGTEVVRQASASELLQ